MTKELIRNLENVFSNLENHNTYFIRNRIYLGGGSFGTGVRPIHLRYKELIIDLKKISNENIDMNKEKLDASLLKITDTIRFLGNVEGLSDSKEDIIKFIEIGTFEVEELSKVLDTIRSFDPTQIADPERLMDEKIQESQQLIEDNLNQLTKSYEWKNSETELSMSIEGKEVIQRRKGMMERAKEGLNLINNVEILSTLSVLVQMIRNTVATDVNTLDYNLPMFISFIKLFRDENLMIKTHSYTIRKDHLSIDDIRLDLDSLLIANKLPIIATIHDNMVNNEEDESINKFAAKLNEIFRDSEEEFNQVMGRIVQIKDDTHLFKLFKGYLLISKSLKTLVPELNKLGLSDMSRKINELKDIKSVDVIPNLQDLYHLDSFDVDNCNKILSTKIRDLKQLAIQLTNFDDVAASLFSIVQFTDLNAQMLDVESLNDYINKIGL